jgi:DNA-binding beta-propeller fold protein YncE
MQRIQLVPGIASVTQCNEGQTLSVAALWSHKLFLLEFDPSSSRVTRHQEAPLPFPPRRQLLLPDGQHLLVADAFGGQLAIVNIDTATIVRILQLPGHNIGGMTLSPDGSQVWLTHQTLDQSLPTTRDNIIRGLLVDNVLRNLSIQVLLDPQANWRRTSNTTRLGSFGAGAGDPAGLAPISNQEQLIAFAGVDEAAVTTPNGSELRLSVGRRPTAVVTIDSGKRYAVLNTLDDSVTFVTFDDVWKTQTISLGPQPLLTSADRGERLFLDARLSAEHWLSCHSCHPDGHTNGLRADTRGDQSFGAPKRVLTLRGTALTDKWAWNGDIQDLDAQVKKSLATTIHSASFTGQDVADLTTFLHKLPHPPPLLPATQDANDRQQLARGDKLFGELGCIQCHIPPRTYTSHGVVDVGLSDELGQSKFNPPSLRGVSQNARFFHDNRAPTLESIFTDFGHQLPRDLAPQELADLVRFLKSL